MSSSPTLRRSVDVGAALRQAGGLLKRHGLAFFLAHAIVLVAAAFLSLRLAGDPGDSFWAGFVNSVLASTASIVAASFVLGVAAVEQTRDGGVVGAAVARIGPRLPMLIALSWVVGLAAVAAALFVIVPGFIVITVWMLALPAAVFESRGLKDSLGRSLDLTRGVRWLTFGVWLIIVAIGFAGGVVGAFLVAVLGFPRWGEVAGSVVGGTLGNPILAAYFLEVRRAKQGGAVETAEVFA